MQGVRKMTAGKFSIDCGPFAKARQNTDSFCHNLFLSHAMTQCVEQMLKVEQEYKIAAQRDDGDAMEQKKLEIKAYQQSLTLTAFMFDEVDEIST
jgi:hypothetical protein